MFEEQLEQQPSEGTCTYVGGVEGELDGVFVGDLVGPPVGLFVGLDDGAGVGGTDGLGVGSDEDGAEVGSFVGGQ